MERNKRVLRAAVILGKKSNSMLQLPSSLLFWKESCAAVIWRESFYCATWTSLQIAPSNDASSCTSATALGLEKYFKIAPAAPCVCSVLKVLGWHDMLYEIIVSLAPSMALLALALKIYFSVSWQFHIIAVILSQRPEKH
jgi:hypothetical protein